MFHGSSLLRAWLQPITVCFMAAHCCVLGGSFHGSSLLHACWQRITAGDHDFKEIRKHPWFAGFDWHAIDDGLMEVLVTIGIVNHHLICPYGITSVVGCQAPWVPEVNGDEDLSNFVRDIPPEPHISWSEDQ